MLVLAEIADKMPTVGEMWLVPFLLACPLAALALHRGWLRWVALVLAGCLSFLFLDMAYDTAYNDPFCDVVWSELGRGWVLHSFNSSAAPLLFVLLVILFRRFVWTRSLIRDVPLRGNVAVEHRRPAE
ncbi:hypothetical protein OT109_08500 [Phycisphaeraceae bacterium D3-23]